MEKLHKYFAIIILCSIIIKVDFIISAQEFNTLELKRIADGCYEQTRRFLNRLDHDTRYCFELLRRAYEERLEDALVHVYSVYVPLLSVRARRHSLFTRSSQDSDAFAHLALARFYRSNQQSRFTQKFLHLPAAVSYLYACLHSVIVEDVRDNSVAVEFLDEYVEVAEVEERSDLGMRELWMHISKIFDDEEDQRLAYLRFVLEMLPAEIVARYPQQWVHERAVSVALQRIRRRLRNDPVLRELAGNE